MSDLRALCVKSFSASAHLCVLSVSALAFALLFVHRKIKPPMPPAPRIKPRPAPRTPRLTLHILPNRHLQPASPAQNRPRIPFPPPPNRNSMPRQSLMTILASPVNPATSQLDRHNVQHRPVMYTPRLRIEFDATHLWSFPSAPVSLRRVTHRVPL